MATNSKGKIEITDLDFDTVKSNFRNFLSQQSQFTDYNANEMFLDTSLTRASAVSHAKSLGYTPSSTKSSNATVNITVSNVPTSQTSLVMSAGTVFNTTVNDISYQFVTIADHTSTSDNGIFQFEDVKIYEGTRVNYTYTVDSTNLEQQFIIPSALVDTTTLTVTVQNSVSDTTSVTYTLNTDYTTLTSTSTKYFLQEIEDGKFEVYFGDGVSGRKPVDGNIVLTLRLLDIYIFMLFMMVQLAM